MVSRRCDQPVVTTFPACCDREAVEAVVGGSFSSFIDWSLFELMQFQVLRRFLSSFPSFFTSSGGLLKDQLASSKTPTEGYLWEKYKTDIQHSSSNPDTGQYCKKEILPEEVP